MHQVTQSPLAGKISTQWTDDGEGRDDERRYRNHRREIEGIKKIASHLSAFPYHILKLLCKLLTAGTLLLNHFPNALMHFRESVFGSGVPPSPAQTPPELVPKRAQALTAKPRHPLL